MTETGQQRRRIVVGVDGSDGSKSALRWAAWMAETTGSGLDVIAAWEMSALYGWSALSVLPANYTPQPEIEKSLNDTVAEVFGAERPQDMRVKVLEGPVVQTLLSAATGALMIVVGSRGHGGFTGMLLGSVSARVAEYAKCPVLVVHGDRPPPS
jgi:nucleotide-binding universal stress UspA family protein